MLSFLEGPSLLGPLLLPALSLLVLLLEGVEEGFGVEEGTLSLVPDEVFLTPSLCEEALDL